jgi:hypothetical protein
MTSNEIISESWLHKQGFKAEERWPFTQDEWRLNLSDSDMLPDEWLYLGIQRGNGTDHDCWDVNFVRSNDSFNQPHDRVTLKHGVRYIHQIQPILRFFTLN